MIVLKLSIFLYSIYLCFIALHGIDISDLILLKSQLFIFHDYIRDDCQRSPDRRRIIQFRQRAPRAKPEPAITIATYLYFIEQLSVAINYGVGGSSVSRHVIFCFPYLSTDTSYHGHLIASIIKGIARY